MYFTFAFGCLALLTHVMYLLVASEKSLAQANHVLTTMLTQVLELHDKLAHTRQTQLVQHYTE